MTKQSFRIAGSTARKTLPILLLLSICLIGIGAQLPKPSADKVENDARVRKFLQTGKLDEAIRFIDACLNTETNKEFYLFVKLQLLKIAKQPEKAIECALLWDQAGGENKVAAATALAELYLRTGKTEETLHWMAQAADRGLKDPRLFGDDIWEGVKKDARYEPILRRIQDNQGIGRPAPDFAVKLAGGEDFNLSLLRGKVVLVDFWATWCPFCIETFPVLKECYEKYHPRGFEIVGISLDQDLKALKNYLKKDKLPWPIPFSGQPWGEDKTAQLYGVEMIPVSFLIDKTGKLRYYHLKKAEFEQAIRTLLDE